MKTPADMARALRLNAGLFESNAALKFFSEKILRGREPYELCIATRDVLRKLDDPFLEANRYLAFKSLALALMGRHVKAAFFNDLMGLPNNHELVEKTGELRNIKRTKSELSELEALVRDPSHIEYWIARHTNNLIALVDSDPAFNPDGREACLVKISGLPAVVAVHNQCQQHHTLVMVNLSDRIQQVTINLQPYGLDPRQGLFEHFTATVLSDKSATEPLRLELNPFGRFWIKNKQVKVASEKLVKVGSSSEMAAALGRRP
jgi:hypothetical protein